MKTLRLSSQHSAAAMGFDHERLLAAPFALSLWKVPPTLNDSHDKQRMVCSDSGSLREGKAQSFHAESLNSDASVALKNREPKMGYWLSPHKKPPSP